MIYPTIFKDIKASFFSFLWLQYVSSLLWSGVMSVTNRNRETFIFNQCPHRPFNRTIASSGFHKHISPVQEMVKISLIHVRPRFKWLLIEYCFDYFTIKSVIPNQYSHQVINETQNPPFAGQTSLFGKLRSKLNEKSPKHETVEPFLNPVQRTEGLWNKRLKVLRY